MTSHQSKSFESLWQLRGFDVQLQAAPLYAHVDLTSPSLGLGDITWNSAALSGSVLGIDLSQTPEKQAFSLDKGVDAFVRGADLVARYPESNTQPFSLEVYWSAVVTESNQVQIDAIVSLQTSLLECYPTTQTVTSLASKEAWFVPSSRSKARRLVNELNSEQTINSDEFAGILLRSADGLWSYLEMTYPEDLGTWQADWDVSGNWTVRRLLGGEFQEKGVIRRLRVRGVFLPQEGDLEKAPQLLSDFAKSPPPLTA